MPDHLVYPHQPEYKDKLVGFEWNINWYPDHIKNGRFGNWLENNVDWALGRERYWGTPLPVWECEGCGKQECVGSCGGIIRTVQADLIQLGSASASCG